MGYMHIENLAKNATILMFRECFALEKIHGTSAHIVFKRNHDGSADLSFFSGGASHVSFVELFNEEALKAAFLLMDSPGLTVYGEAYGGKEQGMRATYGDRLKFVAFDVLLHAVEDTVERWLSVDDADATVQKLGLEFVPYVRLSTDIEALNAERDRPSRQAVRNGITEPKPAEGIVLRPILEFKGRYDTRVISKYKRAEFSERTSKRDTVVDPGKVEILAKADSIAAEWVTQHRLDHVLNHLRAKLQRDLTMADTRTVIEAMIEDVTREAQGEIVTSKDAIKAISNAAVALFKKSLQP